MRSRRQVSSPRPPASAREFHKSLELEQRVARLELRVRDLEEALAVQTNRTVTLEAQLDHLDAKRTHS